MVGVACREVFFFFQLKPQPRGREDQTYLCIYTFICLLCLLILPILKFKMQYRFMRKYSTIQKIIQRTVCPLPFRLLPRDITINSFLCATFQNFPVFIKLFTYTYRVPFLNSRAHASHTVFMCSGQLLTFCNSRRASAGWLGCHMHDKSPSKRHSGVIW